MSSAKRPVLVVELTRHLRGETQADVSRNARIHQPTYSLIEQGRLTPTEEQLERLWPALGLTRGSTPMEFLLERVPDSIVERVLSAISRGDEPVPVAEPTSVQ